MDSESPRPAPALAQSGLVAQSRVWCLADTASGSRSVRLGDVLSPSNEIKPDSADSCPRWARLRSKAPALSESDSPRPAPARSVLVAQSRVQHLHGCSCACTQAVLLLPPSQFWAPVPSDSETPCPASALVGLSSDPGPSSMGLVGSCSIQRLHFWLLLWPGLAW